MCVHTYVGISIYMCTQIWSMTSVIRSLRVYTWRDQRITHYYPLSHDACPQTRCESSKEPYIPAKRALYIYYTGTLHFCKRALSPQKNPTFPPEESWELATIAPLMPTVSACDEHLVGYTHINIRSDISKYHIICTHTTFYQKHTCSVDDAICCYTYNIYTHIRNDISKYQNISFAYVRVCVCMYAWSMYVYTHT